jgi:hypothetical protein
MKFANTVKTLCLVGVTSLGLYAGASHADFGNNQGYQNPYMPASQAHYNAGFKQQLVQFDQRMDNQLQRILKGMEQGKLTMREAVDLLQEHVVISTLERQYLADGRLGPRELFDLDRRLDQASQHILFENRDREQVGSNDRHNGRYR